VSEIGRLRIVVAGMVAGDPGHGGATWAVLQYVLGLRRLGHDVLLVEPVDEIRAESERYFRQVAAEFGLERRAALLAPGGVTVGVASSELRQRVREADLLLNASGLLRDPDLLEPIPRRVYLDLDPVFNQLWHEQGIDVGFVGHTHHVTVGQAIGTDGCSVPTCGIDWTTTLQPVVLSEWPLADGIRHDALTTVGNWRAYGSVEADGIFYGQKAHALRELLELPRLTKERFLLALAIDPAEEKDLVALDEYGWELVDPAKVAGTPADYRRFVQGSKAEFGLTKSGYALARSGWFSDRSSCYLASGRPVIAQETGFSRFVPTGEGLLAFDTADEAASAIDAVAADYERHRRAARELAEEHFDSDRVLDALLADVA
jgi:hypothetical protein